MSWEAFQQTEQFQALARGGFTEDAVRQAYQAGERSTMKDHEIAQLVNRLTAIGRDFGHTQQLRDRISREILTHLKGKTK